MELRVRQGAVRAALMAGLAVSAGCGAGWKVIRQAAPNRLANLSMIGVVTPNFRSATVRDVDHPSTPPKDEDSLSEEITEAEEVFKDKFISTLRRKGRKAGIEIAEVDGSPRSGLRIVPEVRQFFGGTGLTGPGLINVLDGNATATLRIHFRDKDNVEFEEIELSVEGSGAPLAGMKGRVDDLGEAAAERIIEYLKMRR